MSIALEESASVTMSWAQEWHRLTWTAMNQATGHCLHGCADFAMARSPLLAIEAMQQTHTGLLRHSAHVFAEAIMLWRKQNTDLLAMRAKHRRAAGRKRSDLRLRGQTPTDEEVR